MKWFDLSRFGAKLYVLPKSDARSCTVLRLEMRNSTAWFEQRDIAQVLDATALERFAPAQFAAVLNDLGFSRMKSTRLASGTRVDFDNHGAEYSTFAAESVRDSLKLSELQGLMPGLTARDVVDMPLEQIFPPTEDFLGYEASWERLRKAMVNDSIGLFAPNQSPWGQDKKPVPIIEALEAAGFGLNREDRDNSISFGLIYQANALGYRDDALVTYYVNEAAALADGLKEGEFHRCGYSASVPILVVGQGKVVALRDVWAMPDLRRTLSPDGAYGLSASATPQSLVVSYLRQRMDYRSELEESLGRLDKWIADPALLAQESPDLVWGQVAVFAEGFEMANRNWHLSGDVFLHTGSALESKEGNWRLRRLDLIEDYAFAALALSAEKLGIASKEKVTDTLTGAKLLWQQMVNAEIASERVSTLSASPPAITVDQVALDARKHVDVGEKIGGARKDFKTRSLGHTEVAAFNDLEIKLHVNKQNIWPPLSYSDMRERGVEALVAMSVKMVKDSINISPVNSSDMTERECAEKYVVAVGQIRDLFEGVSSQTDFHNALREANEYASDGTYYSRPFRQLGLDAQKVFNRDVLWRAELKVNRATQSWDSQSQSVVHADPWTTLIKSTKTSTDVEVAERKRKAALDKELHIPHLARVERYGEDWRSGRDVTADELLEKFGFRAIEYGEWLPQKERQEVINMAYDSFADLSQALNLRPVDVSLGGELAVAFGARGTGGRSAAMAHFEAGRFVLNLTRMNGAGSLAHEWAHAFDRKMAIDAGTGMFASEKPVTSFSSLSTLVTRMSWRNATADELAEQSAAGSARSKSNAESWLYGLKEKQGGASGDLSDSLRTVRQEISKRIDTLMDFWQGDWKRCTAFGESGLISHNIISQLASDVRSEIVSKWRGNLGKDAGKHIEGSVWHYAKNESLSQTVQAFVERGLPLPDALTGHQKLRQASRYAEDAEGLDKLRSSAYWNTTRELFARACASYVQDKIGDLSGRSDYLVYGAEEGRRADGIVASPNPFGEDRVALKVCFDALLDDYRATLTHEATASADMTP